MSRSRLRLGILAGEASGDILGSRLIAALRQHYDEVQVEGIGGPLMQAQGLHSLFPMDRLSVMGLVEPLKRLPELLRIRKSVRQHFLDNPPDLFIGIDSPDFNLALERKLREAGILTAHLVSPSVWAWRQRRIHKIRRSVDLMLCLFPFETDIYREHDVPVEFVGHPLADEIPWRSDRSEARAALGLPAEGTLLALLPGSRGGEVGLLGPLFLQVAQRLHERHPQLRIAVPAATPARREQLESQLRSHPGLPLTLIDGRSRELMAAADTLLLASGTATLEAALCKRPMVVAYRMAPLSWSIISRLVKTPFAALPNILAGRLLVPELLQSEATVENILAELEPLLENDAAVEQQQHGFDAIHESLRRDSAERSAAALARLVSQPGA